ncbi:hypothetical protein BG452_14430 [Streptomyces sp. CBMA123]|nr:hypothetical protein [Streptomyces sp. CBMA123]
MGPAALATLAAHRTGTATDPAALDGGYALGPAVGAVRFAPAAVGAVAVLPRRRPGTPEGRPLAAVEPQLEGTSS